MTPIPKGSKVRQVVKLIEGQVVSTRFDEDSNQLIYHVTYMGDDGEPSARWFKHEEVEQMKEEA